MNVTISIIEILILRFLDIKLLEQVIYGFNSKVSWLQIPHTFLFTRLDMKIRIGIEWEIRHINR